MAVNSRWRLHFTLLAAFCSAAQISKAAVVLSVINAGTPPEVDLPGVNAGTTSTVSDSSASLSATGSGTATFSTSISYGTPPVAYKSTQNWLTVSTPTKSITANGTPVTITLTGNPTGLQAGPYTATVTFTAGSSTAKLLVTFTPQGVDLTASLLAPLSSLTVGQKAQVGKINVNLTIANGTSTTQSIQASTTTDNGGNWLLTSADSAVNVTGLGVVTLTVDATNLAGGSTHSATITLQCVNGAPCQPQKIPVSVQVNNLPPALSFLTPTSGAAGTTVAVTLSGNYFTGATAIVITGGISVTDFQVVNDTTIAANFVIPANATGAQSLAVSTPSGVSKAISFTVTSGPSSTVTSVLPHVAAGGSFVTGFYVVNSGGSPANFSIVFRNDAGAPISLPFINLGTLSTLSDTIPANGAGYYEAGDPNNPNGVTGSGLVTSDPTITIQAIFRRQTANVYYEAAVPTSAGSPEVITPFDATTFSANGAQIYTGFAIANMDSANSATLTCTARDTQGNIIPNAISVPNLNPSGHWAGYMFPALAGNRGTIDCTSNTKVGSVALRALGLNAISSLPVVSKGSGSSPVTAALPHVAAGGSFVTGFYVLNTAGIPASFSISFHDDSGAPLVLPFSGLGGLTTLSDTIPANGLAYYEAGDPSNPNGVEGSGLVTADPSITIQALFRRQTSNVYYEAAVPTSSGNYEFEVPYDATTFAANGAQIYTGFAIANLDSANAANVNCTARDGQGNVIPNAISVPSLNPSGHWANYQFPALIGNRGTIDCTSSTKIGPVALRALGLNAISSLPIIALH